MSKVTGLAQTQLTPTDQITPEFGRGQRNARRVHRAPGRTSPRCCIRTASLPLLMLRPERSRLLRHRWQRSRDAGDSGWKRATLV